MRIFSTVALLLVAAGVHCTAQQQFYVSPSGGPGGDGSINRPWDLATALAQPSTVRPGAVVWLRGGTYNGTFVSTLNGSSNAPIVVRQYPGERAVLDAGTEPGVVLAVAGSYTWFWGFEITASNPQRFVSASSPEVPAAGIANVQATGMGAGVKFINLVIHDTALGYGWWKEAVNSEIYGNIIYNNGWDMDDRGHGHAIYAQNDTGTMKIADNMVFNQFGEGIQLYGSSAAPLKNFWVEGNVSFNNGAASRFGFSRNILLGGGSVTQNSRITNNYTYYPNLCCGTNGVGYAGGCAAVAISGNYFVNPGDTALDLINCKPSMTGNFFYGLVLGFTPAQYPGNTYSTGRPTEDKVFIRRNKYEAGRANIAIYNWSLRPTVAVDLSASGLAVGDSYTIHNVQDYFGRTITGVYNGSPVSIPMTGWSVAAPVGSPAPASTFPEFGAFVVHK